MKKATKKQDEEKWDRKVLCFAFQQLEREARHLASKSKERKLTDFEKHRQAALRKEIASAALQLRSAAHPDSVLMPAWAPEIFRRECA